MVTAAEYWVGIFAVSSYVGTKYHPRFVYRSVKQQNIIPLALLLFRSSGILLSKGSDNHVYDRKAGCPEVGTV